MIAELLNNLNSDIVVGLAQAAGAIVLCAAVVLLCRWFAVHVERETAISLVRGLVQMVFVGVVLAVLLHGNLLIGVLILLAMTFAAAVTASRRAQDIKGSLLLSFYAIAAGRGRRDRRDARHRNAHRRHRGAGARGQHDHRQRNECLRAIHRAIQGRCRGTCGPDRGGLGARCRPRA